MRSAMEVVSTDDKTRNLDRRELFTGNFIIVDISAQSQDSDFWWGFRYQTVAMAEMQRTALHELSNHDSHHLPMNATKDFLRFKIDENGYLHGYMIGADSVLKRWKINPKSAHPFWIEYSPEVAPVWKLMDIFVLKK
jgi:hypothetical protein